jgi:hypothetical protein
LDGAEECSKVEAAALQTTDVTWHNQNSHKSEMLLVDGEKKEHEGTPRVVMF